MPSLAVCAQEQQQQQPEDLSRLSLEDLMKMKVESVYGASKHLQKVTSAAASITIITADEIRRYGYQTLGDILQNVPGFYITYDRNYTFAAVRGFGPQGDYNSRILLLVDGHRINDNIYDQALLGTEFPVDVDLIDRVEIIQGPSSSIYGSNAFFGVINVITRKAGSLKGMQASLSGGSLTTGYARFTLGGETKSGWKGLFSGSMQSSQGQQNLFFSEYNSPATNNGIAQDADHDRFSQLFANASYKDLTFQIVYGSRQKQVPTASFGTVFNSSQEHTVDSHGYFDLDYEHTFRNQLTLSARTYVDDYWYTGDYPYAYDPQNSSQVTLNRDYSNGAWWGEEIKLSKTVFRHHLITVGNEFRDNFHVLQQNFDVQPYYSYLNDNRSSQIYAFYVQDEYSIRHNLLLTAGIRHDQDGKFGGSTNPRLGLIYNPLEHTTLKFLYGTAFRAPNAYELYYGMASQLANTSLRPETIRTAEVVLEQYFGNTYRLSASVFQNKLNNLIEQDTTAGGMLQYRNAGMETARGTEMAFEAKWSSGFAAQANYTYEHVTDNDVDVGNIPSHLLNANLLVPIFSRKTTAGLNLHYVSTRYSLAGTRVPGFITTNLTFFREQLFSGTDLSASFYNLFNVTYGYPGGPEHLEDILYQNGRTFRIKLSYTFGAH